MFKQNINKMVMCGMNSRMSLFNSKATDAKNTINYERTSEQIIPVEVKPEKVEDNKIAWSEFKYGLILKPSPFKIRQLPLLTPPMSTLVLESSIFL